MEYVGLVCARGGSKGLPGKNTKLFVDKPLVSRAVNTAMQIDRISTVLVSTDSEEIAQMARQEGADTPFMRPAALSGDNSPEWHVWRHAIDYLSQINTDFQGLVVLPPTAPLRISSDIDKCIDLFEKNDFDIVITVTEAARSPYFNMVKVVGDNCADIAIKPDTDIFRRQDAPQMFDMTTVAYVAKPDFVMSADNLFDGQVGYVSIPRERAIDIDTSLDFEFAEFIAKRVM